LRSGETWPRRASFLLVGLLAFVAYLMGAVALARLGAIWTLVAGSLALLLVTVAVAEAAYGFRPTPTRLARADRLVLVAAGTWLAVGVLSSLVLLLQSLFT
jgi:hypothetical protein